MFDNNKMNGQNHITQNAICIMHFRTKIKNQNEINKTKQKDSDYHYKKFKVYLKFLCGIHVRLKFIIIREF